MNKPDANQSVQASPPSPFLHMTASRKRNRHWEKQQQSRKAVYRGIDPNLALKVKAIACDLRIPAGEVACAVIAYALRSHERGDFDLQLHPRTAPTSFPRPQQPSRKIRPGALWRVVTTWRGFSPELKKELAALASEDGLNVPSGELINALLRFGLQAYEVGLLTLKARTTVTTSPLRHTDKRA